LERHLIVSELIIQLFLAFLLSVLFQFLYRKYSYKFLIILIPILTLIAGVIVILSSFNLFASWFQPDYSIVKNEKEKIRKVYSSHFENYSIDEINSIFNQLDKGYRNNWDYKTEDFWENAKNSVLLVDINSLPTIEKFLVKKTEKKSRSNFDYLSEHYEALSKKIDFENKFPIYKNYLPPEGYKVDYDLLDNVIEKIRYRIFIQSKSEIPNYLKIKKQYFTDFKNYWDSKVPKIKTYTVIAYIIIILILFTLNRKKILLKLKNV